MTIAQPNRKINPATDTAWAIKHKPLPPVLRPYKRLLEQLPLTVLSYIYIASDKAGLPEAGFVAALKAAIEFQNAGQWRCGACHRWLESPNLSVITCNDQRIAFVAVCKRCERRHKNDDQLRTAIAGYVGMEAA